MQRQAAQNVHNAPDSESVPCVIRVTADLDDRDWQQYLGCKGVCK